ncbi:MAG: hypothetical protein ISP45_23235 [Reyranella sp.]|nr:hypothetical protein [Reyranella sp.]
MAAPCASRAADGDCRMAMADIQAVRDNLEIVRTQTASAKDNFGPGRAKANAAAGTAIEAFERLVGRTVAPSPDSLVVRTPGGRHNHPRMNLALQALYAARRSLEHAGCPPAAAEPVMRAVAVAEKSLLEALDYNAPGSGG